MKRIGTVLELMSTRRFLPLFLCQFLGAFSDSFIRLSIISLLTYYSNDLPVMYRQIMVSIALGLFMLPFVLLSATGGQLADKYDKAKLIKWIKFASIIVAFVGILGLYLHSYTIMLLSIFLAGIDATLFGPSKYSILPDHLEREELIIGNGLIEAGTFLAILFGMIMGGNLLYYSGGDTGSTSFALMAVTLLGFVSSLFIPATEPASGKVKITKNLIKETKDSISYAKKDTDIYLAILGISWFWLVGGVLMSELPNLTKDVFFSENSVFTLLMSIFSIGTGLGSILCNRILKGQIDTQYVPVSMLLLTIFLFVLYFATGYFDERTKLTGVHYFLSHPQGLIVSASILMLSIAGGLYIVPLYALLQVRSKRSHRSRIIASNNIINAIFVVCGSVLAVILINIGLSLENLLLILALTNLMTTAYIARILPDRIIKSIFQTLLKLIYRVEIVGLENFYKAGDRALIIANHASFLDPPTTGSFLAQAISFCN